jgi:hypothetical protein
MIRRWVDQGVPWPEEKLERRSTDHWAFKPIKAVKPPKVSRKQRVHNDAVHNDIDRFVLAKLAEHKLQPSPEADRATLVRRLSLDLLGLPPSPADVDEFVNDTSASVGLGTGWTSRDMPTATAMKRTRAARSRGDIGSG